MSGLRERIVCAPRDTFYAEVVDADGKRVAHCRHRHASEAAAWLCAQRLARDVERRERGSGR